VTLNEDGVDRKGGLTRTGQARNHHEQVARDFDSDILEVVDASAHHTQNVRVHIQFQGVELSGLISPIL